MTDSKSNLNANSQIIIFNFDQRDYSDNGYNNNNNKHVFHSHFLTDISMKILLWTAFPCPQCFSLHFNVTALLLKWDLRKFKQNLLKNLWVHSKEVDDLQLY